MISKLLRVLLVPVVIATAPAPAWAGPTADPAAPGRVASAGATARPRTDPRHLLPDDDALPGWELAGAPRVFDGKNLFTHIDGGAEEFLALGFRALGVCGYRKDSIEVVAEVYDMGARKGARAILDARGGTSGDGSPANPSGPSGSGPTAGVSSRVGEACVLDSTQILFRRDRFYISVTGFEARPEVTAALRCLADTIDARIRAMSPRSVPR